jgi:peptidoglycan/xylan/chitin deacetylase (PgdA/CDA1 family)
MRPEVFARWAVGVVALGGLTIYFAGAAPVASQQARPVAGTCQPGPSALGVSRVVDIDATQGPRFGGVQYRDHDFLQDGEVVLTFDDGPHPKYTVPILDALDEHCVKATFFMVGRQALAFPKYAREVGRRGHTIGTHTWSHRNLARSSAEQMRAEIELGISAVQVALGGPTAPFFRFPYLAAPNTAQHMLQQRDTANVSIDVDSHDFRTRSPARMISNVLNGLKSKRKGIILFHDIQPSTALGIRQLLAELKTHGYRVVHMRPKQTQSTIAEFDQRIERTHTPPNLEIAAGSVANRSITAPGWETQSAQHARPAAAPPPPAAPRGRSVDDWRRSIFGGGN